MKTIGNSLLLLLASSAFLTVLAADTHPPSAPPPLRPFGIGADAHIGRTIEDCDKWMPKMSAIGVSMLRTPGCNWPRVEPQQGKWDWEGLDAKMKYLDEKNFTYGGMLVGNPKWNTLDKGGLPTGNIPAWSNYVTQIVKHVNGRIKYWEIWNEPPNGTGGKTAPEDYAKIVVAAYDAAKAVDPNCMVGLAAKSVDVNYLEQVIKAGAKGHFDYIVLHPYETLGTVMRNPGTEAVFMNIAPTVRKMLAAQEPSKVNAPIWFTELGFNAKKGADLQASAVVKANTMGIAQGIRCISWFEGMDGDSGPMGLLMADGTPRPSFTAMTQMLKYIGQKPTYLGWLLLNDRDYGFVFNGVKGTVLVIWAPVGQTDTLDFGQATSIIDPRIGTATQTATYALTENPIIVDGVPASLVSQAQANLKKPFPWGGDYTNAKSISVTMGRKNIEKGLHTQSADLVAADIVLYGGNARNGNVPGGTVFRVDPNFLTYTSTPIEITALVRRDDKNTPAKLELVYESTQGNDTKTVPYDIPDNSGTPEKPEWQQATWHINDAQFVSMYGYNFRLNKGNYVIQNVTVTKLDP